jgi:hypothetical protein
VNNDSHRCRVCRNLIATSSPFSLQFYCQYQDSHSLTSITFFGKNRFFLIVNLLTFEKTHSLFFPRIRHPQYEVLRLRNNPLRTDVLVLRCLYDPCRSYAACLFRFSTSPTLHERKIGGFNDRHNERSRPHGGRT